MPKLGVSYALIIFLIILVAAYVWWTRVIKVKDNKELPKESKIDIYINSINEYAKNAK
jgi:hypothetical protein